MFRLFGAAWRYRGFIASSVVNEFKSRFSRSTFGALWIILQPLAQVIIFATILSNVLAARLEGVDNKYAYAIYLISGILCWSLFAEIVQRCQNVFIDNTSLLKKMQFPRIALPVIAIGSSMVNNIALLCVVMVILPILGVYPNVHYLWLPLLIALTVALATGVGLIVGVLNVFMRDVGHVMAVVLQFWFWVTPIIYPIKVVPDTFKASLAFNPVAPLAMAYHDVIVYQRAPQQSLVLVAIVAAVLLLIAMMLFRRASSEMVDVL
ncbi:MULTISPECIES: ABC transporter permease [Lysobacter]|jgi:lipopolysaccharide transport system permease protein|uniref:Transport permease protein n=1 Tax=Lysobacter gummosus TaxID=262324 RepID=A0ABY3X7T1_9GAMM|nr:MULTISPECIES: ABC transporter permease [Lysobacter]ALN93124.1 ABC-2 type transporter family protein [Lysobacter gummosus]UJB20121.1 ABC transporter permease [Lysobacter capsici]UJQ30764.1 ABC transporter permease [Lysobacter gummosus]UNP28633.1 ABC transporter permease [Lysobacter gummosus]